METTSDGQNHDARRKPSAEGFAALTEVQHRHLAAIVEHANDAIISNSCEGSILTWNRAAERITGYSAQEMLGQPIATLFPPQQTDAIEAALEKIRAGRAAERLETAWRRKDGTCTDVWLTLSPVQNEKGLLLGASILARPSDPETTTDQALVPDLPDKKQIESKIREEEVRLNISQRMEALGTLAGGIAHDFNNILASIIGYAELALEGALANSSQHDNLREILTAGMRARDLVRQILNFSHRPDQPQQPVLFKLIAKEALKLLRAAIPTTIDIRANIASDGLVMADPSQLHQLVTNLCTSATHALQPEGGILTVSLEAVTLEADDTATAPGISPGDYLRLIVCGKGREIEPQAIDPEFDPVWTSKALERAAEAGLSMAPTIVRQCGGHIHVTGIAGQGTCVTVWLPLLERRQRPASEPTESLPMGTGKEHILVVDDEVSVVKMVAQMLQKMQYQVTSRTSSIEALALFNEKPSQFDLVITDFTMPNLPGHKLAAELIKIRPDIPIILCTGYSGEISDDKSAKIGVKAFILKPISKSTLAATVRAVLDKAMGHAA
ncbi:MAG: PAS domain S-box protein [Desulfatitalea sp.]